MGEYIILTYNAMHTVSLLEWKRKFLLCHFPGLDFIGLSL